jgi:PAS domain S-box-containing protein
VVLTGLGDEALAIKAVREGAQDYLVKGHIDGYLLARAMRYAIERKRVEEALERLRRQNELILNSAGEGIYGLDLAGNATFVNPAAAKMIGWEIEELIGRPMHAMLHHSKADGTPYPEVECPIYAAFRDGAVHRMDTEVFWRKDGTSFSVQYISTPIRERAKLVGAVVTFKDLTVERQTERLAMLGRVAAGVAHELNNALAVVLACSQLLLKRTDPQSGAYNDLDLIGRYAETCGRIVHDLRLLGRPLPLKRKLVELHPLIEETLKPLEPILASPRVQVNVVLDPLLPPLSADPTLLGQALLNLITNAVKAMPEGGTLTVAARMRQNEFVEIAVSDTGVGIAQEHLHRIFEPFFTIKPTGEGMGLGLTITSRIVQDHGGRVEVKSEVGKGSTFRVLLPILEILEATS